MEDLILVTGYTLVDSWGAVAFVGRSGEAEISLIVQTPNRSDRSFECSNIQGDVMQHCSYFNSVRFPRPIYSPYTDFFSFAVSQSNPTQTPNQCVFIKGFRAMRRFLLPKRIRAAAEPLPDDPDNSREDEIQVTRVPDAPKVCGLFMVR